MCRLGSGFLGLGLPKLKPEPCWNALATLLNTMIEEILEMDPKPWNEWTKMISLPTLI
jgi:hypothetical protein